MTNESSEAFVKRASQRVAPLPEMDILKPKIICVQNRCYRSLQTDSFICETQSEPEVAGCGKEPCDEFETREPARVEVKEAKQNDDCDVEIRELKDSRFLVHVDVPKCFRGMILGSKHQTIKRITSMTNTNIEFPFEHQDGPVVVFGNSRGDVLAARKRILDIVDSGRQRSDFTHFIAAYARDSAVQQNFKQFKKEVLAKHGNARGVTDEIFQNEHRLHITFGILVLLGEKERREADSILKRVIHETVNENPIKEPIKLLIQGLEYMNDDPSDVHVVYAKVKQISGTVDFQLLANKVVKEFTKSRLMIKARSGDVKLHLTLMNSKFRAKEKITETSYNSRRTRESFDATNILVDFNDYYFGEITVNDVEILRHCAFDDRGYYKCTTKIPLKKVTKPKGTSVRMILEKDD